MAGHRRARARLRRHLSAGDRASQRADGAGRDRRRCLGGSERPRGLGGVRRRLRGDGPAEPIARALRGRLAPDCRVRGGRRGARGGAAAGARRGAHRRRRAAGAAAGGRAAGGLRVRRQVAAGRVGGGGRRPRGSDRGRRRGHHGRRRRPPGGLRRRLRSRARDRWRFGRHAELDQAVAVLPDESQRRAGGLGRAPGAGVLARADRRRRPPRRAARRRLRRRGRRAAGEVLDPVPGRVRRAAWRAAARELRRRRSGGAPTRRLTSCSTRWPEGGQTPWRV